MYFSIMYRLCVQAQRMKHKFHDRYQRISTDVEFSAGIRIYCWPEGFILDARTIRFHRVIELTTLQI